MRFGSLFIVLCQALSAINIWFICAEFQTNSDRSEEGKKNHFFKQKEWKIWAVHPIVSDDSSKISLWRIDQFIWCRTYQVLQLTRGLSEWLSSLKSTEINVYFSSKSKSFFLCGFWMNQQKDKKIRFRSMFLLWCWNKLIGSEMDGTALVQSLWLWVLGGLVRLPVRVQVVSVRVAVTSSAEGSSWKKNTIIIFSCVCTVILFIWTFLAPASE